MINVDTVKVKTYIIPNLSKCISLIDEYYKENNKLKLVLPTFINNSIRFSTKLYEIKKDLAKLESNLENNIIEVDKIQNQSITEKLLEECI